MSNESNSERGPNKSPSGNQKQGKAKKKIVIKKKSTTQKKDISEAFRKRKTVPKKAPSPRKKVSKVAKKTKILHEPDGPISKALRGERPAPGTLSHDINENPELETANQSPDKNNGPSTINQATPFDAAVKEATQARRGYNVKRSSGQPASRSGTGNRTGNAGSRGPGVPSGRGAAQAGRFTPGTGAPPRGGPPGAGTGRFAGGRTGAASRKKDDRKKNKENEKFYEQLAERKRQAAVESVPDKIEILESIQVGDLAQKLNLKPSEVIGKLMKMGEMVTINKTIDAETATLVAAEYNCTVKVISLFEETVIKEQEDDETDRTNRPPVVTIMGHVDHGKTKLLDTIRKSDVIAGESGAITQHIGAYQVRTPKGRITFLDTPGHEAFSAMRARGAAVTDIIILVVAADDGVKPQTKEAIAHAKEADVPIIVAVNKIDLPAADIQRVKTELASDGVQADDFGGDVVFCEISAKHNKGIDHLLEMILLQAEVMDLKANPELRASGHVIEARVDAGKGPVATVLIEKGTLEEGAPYVVGAFSGRIRAMFDDYGNRIKKADPSFPVEITGIEGVPSAGDPFQVVESDRFGREIAGKRQHYKQITEAAQRSQPNIGDLGNWVKEHKELKIIIKADVQGSVEAIRDGLLKLETEDVKLRVIHAATGAISEGDVNLAAASEALMIAFHTRASGKVAELAEQYNIDIKYYNIIYDIINDIKLAMEGLLEPDRVEEISGQAEVREIFKISKIGNIAGCMVLSGKIKRNNQVRILRDEQEIFDGQIKALKRHKDDVNEVSEGFECGISIEGFNDIQSGDIIESYSFKEIARTL